MTEDRYQKSEKREPQNTEQGIMNFEGKKTSSFEIPCSIFDIQNKSDIEMESVDRLMNQGIAEKIFPGGVLLVSKKGETLFFNAYGVAHLSSRAPVTSETIFDLASLTKPLATTLAVMRLVQHNQIKLEQHLGQLLPDFEHTDKARVKLEHLLYHNSGLPDYRPYYKALNGVATDSRRKALRQHLVQEPCINPIGQTVLYSDLGFMILAWVVEHVAQQRLDHFVVDEIYQPLGINHLFFIPHKIGDNRVTFAATENCPWRRKILEGQVHDENAYAVGGIEGHAGLFGTADDINRLLIELLFTYHGRTSAGLFQQDLLHQFFKRLSGTDKALGFDTPSRTGSSCGQGFSQDSVGHLGFTGTSFWMDLERSVIVILLTNRVHPSRDNERIKKFRPELHDTVMNAIAGRIF
jgi:CubicO group peptidase (beta-lactamase class C family)